MSKSRKVLILVLVVLAAAAIAVTYWFRERADRVQADGRWKLSSGDAGCYTGLRFMENPVSSGGGVSVEQTTGSLVQMSYGNYEYDGDNKVLIHLTNPEAPVFPVTLSRNGNELSAEYVIDNAAMVCSYTLSDK